MQNMHLPETNLLSYWHLLYDVWKDGVGVDIRRALKGLTWVQVVG